MIRKIDYTRTDADNELLNIPYARMRQIHNKIISSYNRYLVQYGVKPLWKDDYSSLDDLDDADFVKALDGKELQLIFLYEYIGCLVHKDMVSAFVRKFIPEAALDQQVRHLGSQYNWYVLNRGNRIPDRDITVPSGYNYLVSIETPNPKVLAQALKRAGRLAAKNFEELKMAYNYKCATCGIEEGKKDTRDNTIVSLQQGHMDPRKPLTLDNTIPQCSYCNGTYMDFFRFNEHGRVVAVNNPEILLRSPRDIQDEMIEVLLAERQKKAKS